MAERAEIIVKALLLAFLVGSSALFGYFVGFVPLFVTTASAEATVTGEIRISCGNEACYDHADITFLDEDGEQHTVEITLPDGVAIGDQLTIYYDPDNPVNAADGSLRWLSYVAIPASVGMLFALFGIAEAGIRGRKARYKRAEGEGQEPRQAYWDGERWTW